MYGDSFFEPMDIHLSVSKKYQNTRRYVDIYDLCNTLILFDTLTATAGGGSRTERRGCGGRCRQASIYQKSPGTAKRAREKSPINELPLQASLLSIHQKSPGKAKRAREKTREKSSINELPLQASSLARRRSIGRCLAVMHVSMCKDLVCQHTAYVDTQKEAEQTYFKRMKKYFCIINILW